MQKFELILKNEKQKLYGRLTVFLLLFNTAAISWSFFSPDPSFIKKIAGCIALVLLLFSLALYFFPKSGPPKDPLFFITGLFTFLFWVMTGYWWAGMIIACLFGLHFINKRKLIVRFYPGKIEYPSFPKRIIGWNELNNVILKDGWLTIDFKNNRIIQQFTEDSIITGNEKEFNDFCRQLLKQ